MKKHIIRILYAWLIVFLMIGSPASLMAQNAYAIPIQNLLSNSGFGCWSQSDTDKGISRACAVDSGSTSPTVGETVTGATSGATGKIIYMSGSAGDWGANTGTGSIYMGGCAGRFQDNEDLNGSTSGANFCTVNMPDSAAGVDLVRNGEFEGGVGGWTLSDCTLASIAGGQVGNCLELTRTGAAVQTTYQSITTEIGKIYTIVVYVKSGTSGNEACQIYDLNGDFSLVAASTAAWVAHTITWESQRTTTNIALQKNSATAGTMLFDQVALYEITPGCTVADGSAADEWWKDSTVDAYRQHNDGGTYTKDGSFYALKCVPSAANDYFSWKFNERASEEFYQQFNGRAVTFGMWVKTSKATHARVGLNDIAYQYSGYHTGGGAWEWLEVTLDVSAAATELFILIRMEQVGEIGGDTIVYVSQPQLSYGSSIGEGSYSPRQQEIIFLEKKIPSNLLDGETSKSDVAVADLNIEADSLSMLPKGCKAVMLLTQCNDSGSAGTDCYLRFRADSTKDYEYYNSPYGLANDTDNRILAWQMCDVNGDIDYNLEASGANTFDADQVDYVAVQIN